MTQESMKIVLDAIPTLSIDELRFVIRKEMELLRQRSAALSQHFVIGDRVRWVSKHGSTQYGTVKKVLQKNVRITTDDGEQWHVPVVLLDRGYEK